MKKCEKAVPAEDQNRSSMNISSLRLDLYKYKSTELLLIESGLIITTLSQNDMDPKKKKYY